MGCHTWCFQKDKDLSTEDLASIIRERINESLVYAGRRFGKNKTVQYLLDFSEELEKNEDNYEKLAELWEEVSLSADIELHNKVLYKSVDFHDIFRVGNYPEDVLLSLDDTKQFIKDNDCTDISEKLINEFWEKYPNGMIHFG